MHIKSCRHACIYKEQMYTPPSPTSESIKASRNPGDFRGEQWRKICSSLASLIQTPITYISYSRPHTHGPIASFDAILIESRKMPAIATSIHPPLLPFPPPYSLSMSCHIYRSGVSVRDERVDGIDSPRVNHPHPRPMTQTRPGRALQGKNPPFPSSVLKGKPSRLVIQLLPCHVLRDPH